MVDSAIRLINGNEVLSLLKNKEKDILNTIKESYSLFDKAQCDLPHSSFLRFPHDPSSRIIALPGFLGGEFNIAGIKWIASFPSNLEKGIERASASLILNSVETGRPIAILESSTISAIRTAASAALAANMLQDKIEQCSIVGCGLIGFETLRQICASQPHVKSVKLFDLSLERSQQFKDKAQQQFDGIEFIISDSLDAIFDSGGVVILTTTAGEPYIKHINGCNEDTVILNLSLRDLSPQIILDSDNVVDCADHVCRANTSVHLASELVGNKDFIRTSLGQMVNGQAPQKSLNKPTVFSPFGLGVLDLALAKLVLDLANESDTGLKLDNFLPSHWLDR